MSILRAGSISDYTLTHKNLGCAQSASARSLIGQRRKKTFSPEKFTSVLPDGDGLHASETPGRLFYIKMGSGNIIQESINACSHVSLLKTTISILISLLKQHPIEGALIQAYRNECNGG